MTAKILRVCGAAPQGLLFVYLLLILPWVAAAPPYNAVASADLLATKAGLEILDQGGNAFDAAVAISAALAVVEPTGSGLGGGGFWLLHRAADGKETMIDGRERAPFAASRNMFLNAAGEFEQQRSINGPLSAGIPGMPAAMVHLAEHYGRLPLKTTLAAAIRYAREGFAVGETYLRSIVLRYPAMKNSAAAADIFLRNGAVPEAGFRLVQKDLAHTLERIAAHGVAGFYSGPAAAALVEGTRDAGGLWTLRDLEEYRVVERDPLHAEYKGIRVTSAPPPSSGGVVLTESLNMLSGFDLRPVDTIDRKHLVVEAMRRAYRDRARYLGDPDFVSMPVERLTSMAYADELRADIRLDRAGFPVRKPSAIPAAPIEAHNTTHFSILDKEGNRVAATLSINYAFGSCFVPPGTGVLLNDEMDDFVSREGSGNIYGLTGGDPNRIEPGKRMLSSMTPTFLEDEDRVAILGTPGGSRIISMVLLATLDFAQGQAAASWVRVPRYHHQYLPDLIQYEKGGLTEREITGLQKKGHRLNETSRPYGNMQVVLWDKKNGRVTAASDPRGDGWALVR
ncbi:MAG: gamma-glutamyltransferase [Methylococcaceae bacterium]|nr:gamma-glutamyltransferase [Methylococcaceae bacterium]